MAATCRAAWATCLVVALMPSTRASLLRDTESEGNRAVDALDGADVIQGRVPKLQVNLKASVGEKTATPTAASTLAATPVAATLDSYGGSWVFVNEPGRSISDVDDLATIQPGGYYLPTYSITTPFDEVLVHRLSDNWCDSWGRNTGHWVQEQGASMGVQADLNYWYTYNNHAGAHTWLRQPTSYLPPGTCNSCWAHPGNGNEYDTQGVQIEGLESDGSVVKIKFPDLKTMLKVGNLDSFYGKAGGCDANSPVRYRVYVRQTLTAATLDLYGGSWVFVNEPGRSISDVDDLATIQPGGYYLPTYSITTPFDEVLVHRLSDNWCDSWSRNTGHWVQEQGASMGVQADWDYWYTYNNHAGVHTWLRQPTSYLPPGTCNNCWAHPGNGNEYDTQGVQIEELESDGSVVKIKFPDLKTMLKVGNLDSFYGKFGGCDANSPVRYRVYVRPTPANTNAGAPGAGDAAAVGDPHLQNIHGQRFDLMMPGTHVLLNVPRELDAESALLRVAALASRLGGHCKDIYFTEVNITGSWAYAQQVGGYRFRAQQGPSGSGKWFAVGKVGLKVVNGHTEAGAQYLNLFVKHLGRTGFSVGGLLGDDDHSGVSELPASCVVHVSLQNLRAHVRSSGSLATAVAVATFA